MKMKLSFFIKQRKKIAALLIVVLSQEVLVPLKALALTSGPTQPEVAGFQPIGLDNMVDPFSGDFSYNIPLLNIDGYPINMSYASGIGGDQEASWVGLGWSLNPGAINRSLRGLPDEFNGDVIKKEINMRPNRSLSISVSPKALEIAGFDVNASSNSKYFNPDSGLFYIKSSLTLSYNNYQGFRISTAATPSLALAEGNKSSLTSSLTMSSGPDGLTVQPNISYEKNVRNELNKVIKKSNLNLGLAFNSLGGLQTFNFGASKELYNNEKLNLKPYGNAGFNFGLNTYTPSSSYSFINYGVSFAPKIGTQLGISDIFTNISGTYSEQRLKSKKIDLRAFGYFYHDNAILGADLQDFNRDKDGSYSINTPNLSYATQTYDFYSVSGQGISGSFRGFRSDVSYVSDVETSTTGVNGSFEGEFATGLGSEVGMDIKAGVSHSTSGFWENNNESKKFFEPHGKEVWSTYEPFYLKQIGELSVDDDPTFFDKYGGVGPSRMNLQGNKLFTSTANTYSNSVEVTSEFNFNNRRIFRAKRNQVFSIVNRADIAAIGLEDYNAITYAAPDHHVGEISVLRNDGARYVYGIGAYNTEQHDVAFNVGIRRNNLENKTNEEEDASSYKFRVEGSSGLVKYEVDNDNTVNNTRGLNHFYSREIMPAYAHSYLLTAILSSDYVDIDGIRGPSDGDIGSWTKFEYKKLDSLYQWRTPFEISRANHNESLKSDRFDDQGNYSYGKKEIWYLNKVITKNTIALFHTEKRKDAFEAYDQDGGLGKQSLRLLRKISLYSKPDYQENGVNTIPIKEVHFEYDYSLCPNLPNNCGASELSNGVNINANKGKLTLKKLYFTYGSSLKAKFNPYTFDYNSINPGYGLKNNDRWGTFKPQYGGSLDPTATGKLNSEHPYTKQTDSTNQYSYAWTLTDIHLPSGGKIKVHYQSDDYAYVQNKLACEMLEVHSVAESVNPSLPYNHLSKGNQLYINGVTPINNNYIIFKLKQPLSPSTTQEEFNRLYINNIPHIYFRCLADVTGKEKYFEYVSGYCDYENFGMLKTNLSGDYDYGYIKLKSVSKSDNSTDLVNPIAKAVWQFARLNVPQKAFRQPDPGEPSLKNAMRMLNDAAMLKGIINALMGPNQTLKTYEVGRKITLEKSMIKLYTADRKKMGGGTRVKKIEISDEWGSMIGGSNGENFTYGQEFDYTTQDELGNTISSGVAENEPLVGADESTLKWPIYHGIREQRLLAPDDRFYQETPYMESLFPNPSVGYSKVTVKNLQRAYVNRHATGKVVHEFYTAKDFPAIESLSNIEGKNFRTVPISQLRRIQYDHATVSQGFALELNDMHGKPKAMWVYQEDNANPISGTSYQYQQERFGNHWRLNNSATVIRKNGTFDTKEIGVETDITLDFRQDKTVSASPEVQLNNQLLVLGPFPIPGVYVHPAIDYSHSQFRSATITKVIRRYGILKQTTAYDLGSKISTENLAYDAETGGAILTRTKNEFEDDLYSFTYPTHWYYQGMGHAYKNIGLTFSGININSSGVANVNDAKTWFIEGDEIISAGLKGWVSNVSENSITIINEYGNPFRPNATDIGLKIIRSGARNLLAGNMGSFSSMDNPLNALLNNEFTRILSSSSQIFSQVWKTYCECFTQSELMKKSTNPFATGRKGIWRPVKAYTFLTGRQQTIKNANTDIRRDGVFTSYNPFWKNDGKSWSVDPTNWTWTTEITETSPFGMELENVDPLNRYSSATYGYNNTLVTAASANARYQEIGFDGFEDYDFNPCNDAHFGYSIHKTQTSSSHAHTGKRSISVFQGGPAIILVKPINQNCNP